MATRRQFIQVGVAGGAILAAAGWVGRPMAAAAPSLRFLDASGAAMTAAFVPVVLGGVLPEEPEARARAVREVVEAFDRAVSGLSPAVQKEVEQLYAVLRFAPTRLAFTGLWSAVEDATRDDVAAFLARWRHSRFDIQRAGYQALTQLIQAAWYGNTASWAAIGYPGPPALGAR